jgi:hypothetical protein
VYIFKPADAINMMQGGDNGTPLQKDEPQAQNPPNGAVIDYYLRTAATGPVTLEIIDAAGTTIRTFSSQPGNQPVAQGGRAATGGIPNVSPLWRPAPEPLSVAAGMHRVVWNPVTPPNRGQPGAPAGPEGRGGGTPITGSFTAKLSVNGRTYTQPFVVKPDPRIKER